MSADDRTSAIINQIHSWMRNVEFEALGATDIDRAIAEFDWRAEVDSTLSASANWSIIKDKLGLMTKGETEEMLRAREEEEIATIRDEIRAQIAEFGLEAVANVVAGNPGPPALEARVADVLEEEDVPPDVYDAEARHEFGVLLELLDSDFRMIREDRLEELREQAAEVAEPAEVRERLLGDLGAAFGMQFESVPDAVRSLRERIELARGERLRIASIRVRVLEDELRVSIEDGEAFEPFEGLVDRRVRRTIDFSGVTPPQTVTAGEVSIRGRADDVEIEAIDLESGIERFGALKGVEELPPAAPEREQERLEELTEATQLADRFIAALEEEVEG